MNTLRGYTGWTFSDVQCKADDRLTRIGLPMAVAYLGATQYNLMSQTWGLGCRKLQSSHLQRDISHDPKTCQYEQQAWAIGVQCRVANNTLACMRPALRQTAELPAN